VLPGPVALMAGVTPQPGVLVAGRPGRTISTESTAALSSRRGGRKRAGTWRRGSAGARSILASPTAQRPCFTGADSLVICQLRTVFIRVCYAHGSMGLGTTRTCAWNEKGKRMRSTWTTVVRRAAEALGRRRRGVHEDDSGETDEAGFTLIELMVVLLIMGILMAIAIPTFLGATKGANDKGAQSNLVNSMTSAKTIYAQNGKYPTTATMVTDMTSAEPELHYVVTTTASTDQTYISVATTGTNTKLAMAAWSKPTTICWVALDTEKSKGIKYGLLATGTAQATCKASTTWTGTTVTGTVTWNVTSGWPTAPAGH
jgi:type IV pilus assembly protein PilA